MKVYIPQIDSTVTCEAGCCQTIVIENQKGLITKIVNRMQQRAMGEDYFLKMSTLVAEWEQLLLELSTEMTGHISFSKVNIESLIKAAGVEVENVYDNLGEKLLDYFELVQIYDHNKLFS